MQRISLSARCLLLAKPCLLVFLSILSHVCLHKPIEPHGIKQDCACWLGGILGNEGSLRFRGKRSGAAGSQTKSIFHWSAELVRVLFGFIFFCKSPHSPVWFLIWLTLNQISPCERVTHVLRSDYLHIPASYKAAVIIPVSVSSSTAAPAATGIRFQKACGLLKAEKQQLQLSPSTPSTPSRLRKDSQSHCKAAL